MVDRASQCIAVVGGLLVGVVALGGCPEATIGDPILPDGQRPSVTVHVSKLGSDTSDGFERPVGTLRRALGIANENRQVTRIAIDAGLYAAEFGERFPYLVTNNLTISGSPDGVRLRGTGVEDGLLFDSGSLEGVTLENFQVAIRAIGKVELSDVSVSR
jgi:hypothetical protein